MHTINRIAKAVLFVACGLVLLSSSSAVAQQQKSRLGPFEKPRRSVRSLPFDVKHISLALKFDFEHQAIDGRAVHRLSTFSAKKTIVFDAAEMIVTSVRVAADFASLESAKNVKFKTAAKQLSVELPKPSEPGRDFFIAITYLIRKPKQGAHFVVPDKFEPGQSKMVWTQSEPEFARYWFPCFDSPNDRCTSDITATVPKDFFVLSNGALRDVKDNDDGTKTWHWYQAKNHVPYLFSVVAGKFVPFKQEWDGISVTSYVPPDRIADAKRSFGKTAAMVRYFSEKIGVRYPWAKYTQICVDEYGWGGMEHTSATTLNVGTLHDQRAALDVSSDGLVAHELAHQWFGDLLTCKDWGELWLNESFATYFATLWQEHDLGWDEATWKRHEEAESYKKEDKDKYRRPIVTYRYPNPSAMFDRHTYPKGGRVLHMLRFVLGDEMFWKSIHEYTKKNQFGVVETTDLRVAVQNATGEGLNWFFEQWIYHGGHPIFEVSYEWNEKEKTVQLTVKQNQKTDSLTPLFRMPVEIELTTSKKTIARRVTVSKKEETFHFDLDEKPRRVCFDPRDWILKELTFKKSKQELIDQLKNDPNIMCRVRAIAGLSELVGEDQQINCALYVAATGDSFWGVRLKAVEAYAKIHKGTHNTMLLQIAKSDKKSKVRIAAVKALAKFKHENTNVTLRQIIAKDRSYYVVAQALRTLVETDPKGASPDLNAALTRDSHRQVILKAAAEGLTKLKTGEADERLIAMLSPPSPYGKRMAVVAALAKLAKGDPRVTGAIAGQLSSPRSRMRKATISALGETSDPLAIDILKRHKANETDPRLLTQIEAEIKKLEKNTASAKLQKKFDTLQKQYDQLQSRIKKLESAKKK